MVGKHVDLNSKGIFSPALDDTLHPTVAELVNVCAATPTKFMQKKKSKDLIIKNEGVAFKEVFAFPGYTHQIYVKKKSKDLIIKNEGVAFKDVSAFPAINRLQCKNVIGNDNDNKN